MKKLLPKCKEWRMDSLFSLKVFMLLAMIVGGTNGVWAQTVTWSASAPTTTICKATLTGVDAFSTTNVTATVGGSGFTTNDGGKNTWDGKDFYKLASNQAYVNLKRTSDSFHAGDKLKVTVGSPSDNRVVSFKLKAGTSDAEFNARENINPTTVSNGYTIIEYTLQSSDINDDGSISIYRAGGTGYDCRYYEFEVECSSLYATQELSNNTDILSVITGFGSWEYNAGRGGITNKKQGAPTWDDETCGACIIIRPKVNVSFSLSTYCSQNNCNLRMYEDGDPSSILKDFRQGAYQINDFGTLLAGKTYLIYGDSFKGKGDLDYIFFKSFTATVVVPKITFSAPKVFGWADPNDTQRSDVTSMISAYNNTQSRAITSGENVNPGDEIVITAYQYADNNTQINGDATVNAGRLVLYNWKINGVEDYTNIPSTGIVWYDNKSTYTFTVTDDIDIQAIYDLSYVIGFPSNDDITGGSMTAKNGDTPLTSNVSGMKAGTQITLEATPNAGYVFDHWEGKLYGTDPNTPVWQDDDWSKDPSFTFTIDGANTFDYANGYDIKVTPIFRAATIELTNNVETITKTSATEYEIDIKKWIAELNGKTPSFTIRYAKDNVSSLSAVPTSDGVKITSAADVDGGAVIVNVKVGDNDLGDYVINVPYIGNHTWDFHRMSNKSEEQTTGNFALEYEVKEGSTHKNPLSVYQSQVKENNAAVIEETNGLTITSNSKRNIGLSAIGPAGTTNTPQDISAVTDVWLVAIKNSTLTLPQLKKDWFVKMYFLPHAGGTQNNGAGTEFTVSNLSDLNGKVINPAHTLVTNGVRRESNVVDYIHDKENIAGCMIFRVTNNGDVKFNFANNGWNKIVKIVVTDTYSTELMLGGDNSNRLVDYYRFNHSWVYREYDSSYGKENTDASIYYNGGPWVNGENAYWINHTIDKYSSTHANPQIEGTLSGITLEESSWASAGGVSYQGVRIHGNQGVGNIKVISYANYAGKVKNNGWETQEQYVLNTNESWIAVGKLKVQKYPYTWDFTSYNMDATNDKTVDKIKETAGAEDTYYGSWNAKRHNRIVSVPGTPDETSPYYHINSDGTKDYNVMIYKPLFANGSQLTIGTDAVRETEGLGISVAQAYLPVNSQGNPRSEQIILNGSSLSNNSGTTLAITIPEVPAGMYVFVNSTAAPLENDKDHPSWKVNLVESDVTYASHDKVFYYRVPETKDVVMTFPVSTEIYKIGVTDQIKDITYYGWTTESRAIAIDHNETGSFSAVTKAYKVTNITGWDKTYDVKVKDGNITELPSGVHIPAGNGILLKNTECTWTKAQGILDKEANKVTVPLFVPAVNIAAATEADLSGNLLVASTTETTPSTYIAGTTVTDHDQYYTLSNYYYKVHENNTRKDDVQVVSDPAFYRYIGSGTTLVNKAYLKMTLPSSGNAAKSDNKGFDDSDETTGISEFIIDNEAIEVGNDTYYNVSGQALNSIPVQHGIYIKNGKKIYVK